MDFFTHLYSEPHGIALSSIVLVNAAQTVHFKRENIFRLPRKDH